MMVLCPKSPISLTLLHTIILMRSNVALYYQSLYTTNLNKCKLHLRAMTEWKIFSG